MRWALKCRKVLQKKIIIDHHQDHLMTLQTSHFPTHHWARLANWFTISLQVLVVDQIDANIATALYLGILTDTGSFRFPSVTPNTHRVVAHLIEEGANPTEISRLVKDTAHLGRLQLLGIALKNLRFDERLRTATITLSHAELTACDFQKRRL